MRKNYQAFNVRDFVASTSKITKLEARIRELSVFLESSLPACLRQRVSIEKAAYEKKVVKLRRQLEGVTV